MNLEKFKKVNNVIICTPIKDDFEKKYLEIREEEKRLLNDEEVKILPKTFSTNPNSKEWKLREINSNLFINYLNKKTEKVNVLDLGCGNGWFSHHISSLKNTTVFAIDVNSMELEQAARIFQQENLYFIYKDIFVLQEEFCQQFDTIVLNASIQYFKDFNKLIKILKYYLKPGGEIHILDSFFYSNNEIQKAKENSEAYYKKQGTPEMTKFYFHHKKTDVLDFEIMNNKKTIFDKLFSIQKSPFNWYKKTI